MKQLNKLSIGDRLLMVWYWLVSFGFFQDYTEQNDNDIRVSCYKTLWRTIRDCDFESSPSSNYREHIGSIAMQFYSDGDLESIEIDGRRVFSPRSIAVLCKKKRLKTKKMRKKENTLDSNIIVETYVESKGL